MKNMTPILCSEIAKRQNIDDNFGKTECVNARLTIFLTAEFCGKRAKLTKLGKKNCTKKWFPGYKGPRNNGIAVYLCLHNIWWHWHYCKTMQLTALFFLFFF